MTEEIFLEKMIEILDVEGELTMDTQLDDIEEWDSLSVIGYVAMANASCNKTIAPADVRKADTIRDLFDMLA